MAYPKPAPDRILIETRLAGLRRWSAQRRRAGERIGLVPTMGALHDGHLALVAALGAKVDRVAVTIFVNPTQFAPGEDFARYPRKEAEDIARLTAAGVDLVYMPEAAEIYPAGFATEIAVKGSLTESLEAVIRPGHFTGVATVVAKLLLQATPDAAAFGEKDYQQLQVVRRLARDLDLQVEIIAVPTVRDSHGLALSSRNAYLSETELETARCARVKPWRPPAPRPNAPCLTPDLPASTTWPWRMPTRWRRSKAFLRITSATPACSQPPASAGPA
jgi:pantoate--beta-alanine ligase